MGDCSPLLRLVIVFCYAIVTARSTVKLLADADLAILAPLGCGVQTGFSGVTRSLDVRTGSSIAIPRGGAVGLSAVIGSVYTRCANIIVVEPRVERRRLALELGSYHAIDPSHSDVTEAVRSIETMGVNYIFDISAIPSILQASVDMLGSKGKIVLVGVQSEFEASLSLPIIPTITYGQSVKGTIEGDSNPGQYPNWFIYIQDGFFPQKS